MKHQDGSQFFKGLVLWVAGLVFAGALYAALDIPTNINNAVQTIQKIVITSDGQAPSASNQTLVVINSGSGTPTIQVSGSMVAGAMGGSDSNSVNGERSSVVGGKSNSVIGDNSTIIGGTINKIVSSISAMVGGTNNFLNGMYSSIIGSSSSALTGTNSIILGGGNNKINANSSTAGGSYAQANHNYTWVWSDYDSSYDPSTFASAKSNTFLIRALNGVGINTNNPSYALDVNGRASASSLVQKNSAAWDHTRIWHDGSTSYYDAGGAENGMQFRIGTDTQAPGSQAYANVMRILANGNVGIGTTSPAQKLDINGSVAINGSTVIDSNKNIYPGMQVVNYWGWDGAGITKYGGGYTYLNGGVFYVQNASHFRSTIDNDASPYLQINGGTAGYTYFPNSVGVGINTPTQKLDVNGNIYVRPASAAGGIMFNGTNATRLYSDSTAGLWMLNTTSSKLYLGTNYDWDAQTTIAYTPGTIGALGGVLSLGQTQKNNANYTHGITNFYTNGQERMRINKDGNVGIGTTSPAAKLDIGDGINAAGSYPAMIIRKGTSYGTTNFDQFYNTVTDYGLKINTDQFVINKGLTNIGIGTTYPVEKLEVAGNFKSNGLRARGHDVIAGANATAAGVNSQAYGDASVAMGYGTKADAEASVALGYRAWANGKYSTAMGNYTTANGESSTAMGDHTTADGSNSVTMGTATKTFAKDSVAMGYQTQSKGMASLAMGYNTVANGHDSTALGYNTVAGGDTSVAAGFYSSASAKNSFVFGYQLEALSDNTFVVGQYNQAQMDSLFEVGAGIDGETKNALTVKKDGTVYMNKLNVPVLMVDKIVNRSFTNITLSGAFLPDTNAPMSIRTIGNNASRWGDIYANGFVVRGTNANVQSSNGVALGSYTTSVSDGSVAIGHGAYSAGPYSVSLGGSYTNDYAYYSTAMGSSSVDNATNATAMGSSYVANADYATAMGNSYAYGPYSTAMGSSYVDSESSTAMGNSYAYSPYSTAMGNSSTNGFYATAMGSSSANADYATSMGQGTQANANSTTVIGKYNAPQSNSLFEIGMGTAWNATANAMTVLNNGNVGIGKIPSAGKLDIQQTAGSAAIAMTAGSSINFGNDVYMRSLSHTDGLEISNWNWSSPSRPVVKLGGIQANRTDLNNYFAGNVGIATTTPTAKLDVNGAFKQGGTYRSVITLPSPSANAGAGKWYIRLHPANQTNLASVKVTVQGAWNYAPIMGWLTAEYSYYAPGNGTISNNDFRVTSTQGSAYSSLRLGNLEVENGYVSIPVWSSNTNSVNVTLEYNDFALIKDGLTNSNWMSSALPAQNFQSVQGNLYVDGNIGIGNASPSYKLDVSGQIRSTDTIYSNANGKAYFCGGDDACFNDVNVANMVGIYGLGDSTKGALRLGSAGADIYGSAGNIGIGTTTPQTKLHIASNYPLVLGSDGMLKIKSLANANGSEIVSLQTSIDGRTDDYTISSYGGDSRHILSLQSQGGYVGIGRTDPSYKLDVAGQVRATDTITAPYFNGPAASTNTVSYNNSSNGNNNVQFMQLSTGNSAGDNPTNSWVSIMKMNHGDGDTYYNRTLAFDFFSNAIYTRKRQGGTAGDWSKVVLSDLSDNITAAGYYYSSDISLKKDIKSLDNALDKINKLNGYSFSWKSNGKKDIGVIAQEVEKVFPEIVHADDKGIKSVEYANLVAPIIEAIKSLTHKMDTLFTKYLDQEARIDALEKRLQKLELTK